MICDDLREWLDLLRAEGELVEIDAEVDPYLEITEICARALAANGPALSTNTWRIMAPGMVHPMSAAASRAVQGISSSALPVI